MIPNAIKMRAGFTLIEILVVISIIGVILGLAFVSFQETKKSARDAQRKADLEDIRSGLEVYKADCGGYPVAVTNKVPSPLIGADTSGCPSSNTYISPVPTDPSSGKIYYYNRLTGTSYELCTALENIPASPECTDKSCGSVSCNYKVSNP